VVELATDAAGAEIELTPAQLSAADKLVDGAPRRPDEAAGDPGWPERR